jgi:hypothetical protein
MLEGDSATTVTYAAETTGQVLDPLPDRDFDVSEVTVPWHIFTTAGHALG